MKNLMNFFFSFDKLMKEKLIVPFFWLAIILTALYFSTIFLETIWLGPLAKILNIFTFFVAIVFTLVGIRLLCELMVAIFRINNNLSPDGGKSETADIDPMVEARKAAEAAAIRAREVTKNAGEKASAATKTAVDKTKHVADNAKDSVSSAAGTAARRTKTAANDFTTSAASKTTAAKKTKTTTDKKPASTSPKKTTTKTGSAKKTTPKKPAAKKTKPKTAKRRAKPDLDPSLYATDKKGNIIFNKDGSPRKKPGRKKT